METYVGMRVENMRDDGGIIIEKITDNWVVVRWDHGGVQEVDPIHLAREKLFQCPIQGRGTNEWCHKTRITEGYRTSLYTRQVPKLPRNKNNRPL